MKNESSALLLSVAGIDLLIVLLNVSPTGNSGADQFLSLDDESNFVVWYSSSKLLIAAALCVLVARSIREFRWTFRLTGLALLGVSMSETSMFHERLSAAIYSIRTGEPLMTGGSGIWVVYFAPMCLVVLLLLARLAYRMSKMLSNFRWPMVVAAALWVVVLLAETAPRWAGASTVPELRMAMLIEESCELFGATALLVGLLSAYRQTAQAVPVGQEAV